MASDGRIVIDVVLDDGTAAKSVTNLKGQFNALDRSGGSLTKISGGIKNITNAASASSLAVMDMGSKTNSATAQIRAINKELKHMENQMKLASYQAMIPLKLEMIGTRMKMMELSQSMGNFSGSTKDFMGHVQSLGSEYKKSSDAMINANKMIGASIIQTAGVMLNMTTQASKISDNYERMKNPMYAVNTAGLAIANSLNKIANSGNASVLALKMLGPNASMKQLYDMQMMINQGLMRFQMVALAAAASSVLLYTNLFKIASGPNPADVYREQEEALAQYAEAVETRTNEIMSAWNLFEKVQLEKTTGAKLTKNLQEQVETLTNWKENLATIAESAGTEFSNYLAQMGPQSASEVAAIANMTGPELDNYVALWREKMALAKDQAVTELEGLRLETETKVKALQDSLTPLGLALEPMKQAVLEAIQPMVQAFTAVAVPVANFITKIAEMVTAFNEAHPTAALVIQGIMMLIPALTLLLSPLAIGIGMLGGFLAAWSNIWMLIGPLVTGLAAMSGTVLLVAAALVGLTFVIKSLWDNNEQFRTAVIEIWESIKSGISTAVGIVSEFIASLGDKLKAFWESDGQQILQAVSNVFNGIKAVIEFVMPAVQFLIEYVWNAIKNVITGALDVIMGVVKVFSGLFTGDFSKMWEGVKQIFSGAIDLIIGWLSLSFVGGIRTLLTNLGKNALNLVKSMWDDIVKAFSSLGSKASAFASEMATKIVTYFTNLFTKAKDIFGTLKTFGATIWEALKQVVVNAAKSIWDDVVTKFNGLLSSAKTIMTNVKTTISNLWNEAVNFIKNFDMVQIGKDIIGGLIKGIGSMSAAAIQSVTGVVDGVINKAKSLLGIKSPSRVFMSIGNDTIEGWEVGMANRKKNLNNVMIDLSNDLVNITARGRVKPDSIINKLRGVKVDIGNFKPVTTVAPITKMLNSVGSQPTANISITSNIQSAPVILDGQKIGEIIFNTVSQKQFSAASINALTKGVNLDL